MKTTGLLTIAVGLLGAGSDAFPQLAKVLKGRSLDDHDTATLAAITRDPEEAERLLAERSRVRREKRKADPQLNLPLDLPLGGGLVGGVLQSLSGVLQDIDIPTPQPFGLKEIPGDDPDHQFQKPGPTDVRGMCPTLNALANHGYISRDGISSFAEVANACQIGFGLGYDVSVFLSAFGLTAGGDLLSWKYSIGGQYDRVPNTLGLAPGLDSHGGFEIDTSITRQDTHWGNNANFINDQWLDYVELSKQYGGNFGFDMNVVDAVDATIGPGNSILRSWRAFFWLFVTHVERVFVFALLPNGTNPDVADYQNVAPFFLDERFPPNWYRRATPWTAPQNFGTAFQVYFTDPKELGANVGVGNFVPLAGPDLATKSPEDNTCLVVMNLLDLIPSQWAQPALLNNRNLFDAFWKGMVAPFFVNDGHFNCPVDEFSGPSQNAGVKGNVYSASGSPVNGSYEGIGFIKADGPS